MARLEYKYLVPVGVLPELRKRLTPYVEIDPHAAKQPNCEYTVRSIYLDTPHLDFYSEKKAGLLNRKKVRIRGYNDYSDDAMVYLEIKRKRDQAIIKNRTPVAYQDVLPLLRSGNVERYVIPHITLTKVNENAKRFLYQIHKNSLRTIILITYDREAFFYKLNPSLRITFDKNLRCKRSVSLESLFTNDNCHLISNNVCILEIKTNITFPDWLKRLLSHLHITQRTVSKYTKCIDFYQDWGWNCESWSFNLNNGYFHSDSHKWINPNHV
jgi:SPX domain protein involved in polyphosphate accumulation